MIVTGKNFTVRVAQLEIGLIFLTLSLTRLQNLIGGLAGNIVLVLVILPYWIVIFRRGLNIFFRKQWKGQPRYGVYPRNKSLMLLAFVLIILLNIAYVRAIISGMAPIGTLVFGFLWLTMLLFGTVIFLSEDVDWERYKLAIFDSVGLYIVVNVILSLLFPSLVATRQNPAILLSSLGISVNRIGFPLAGGINVFGAIAASSVLISYYQLRIGHYQIIRKSWYVIVFLVSIYALLRIDSRSATLFLIITLFLRVLIYRWKPSLYLVLACCILFPLAFVTFDQPVFSDFGNLSRSNSDASTLNNRSIIWSESSKFFSKPVVSNVFGYGIYGHAQTGVSKNYPNFNTEINTTLGENINFTNVHNTMLQYLFDVGYMGLICFLLLAILLIKAIWTNYRFTQVIKHYLRMSNLSEVNHKVFEKRFDLRFLEIIIESNMFFFLVFLGAFDTPLTIYNREIFLLFIMLITSYFANPYDTLWSDLQSVITNSEGTVELTS